MKKAYKFRIYPKKKEESRMIRTISTCRHLYNESLAKVHRKIKNQRKDFAHKTSKKLVDKYDHVVFENLHVQNMMANHHLAKSISDAGWSQLISMTKSKAEYAGKVVELVNPRNTSQVCICGYPVPKDLSVRWHSCPACGLEAGRDRVSGILIGNRGTDTVP